VGHGLVRYGVARQGKEENNSDMVRFGEVGWGTVWHGMVRSGLAS